MKTLEDMRLKCVGSLIDSDALGNGGDVWGRSIDFTFRMEQFADITHLVINEGFFNSLGCPEQLGDFRFKVTERIVKGWENPQRIVVVVTGMDNLTDAIRDDKPDPRAQHVLLELCRIVLDDREKPE